MIAYVSTPFTGVIGFILSLSVLLPLCCILCLGKYLENPQYVAILFFSFGCFALSMNVSFFVGRVEFMKDWGLDTYPCLYERPDNLPANETYGCSLTFSSTCLFGTTAYDCRKSYSDMDNITSGYQNCSTVDYNGKPPSEYKKWYCPTIADLNSFNNLTATKGMERLRRTYDTYYGEAIFVGIFWSFGFVIYCIALYSLILASQIKKD